MKSSKSMFLKAATLLTLSLSVVAMAQTQTNNKPANANGATAQPVRQTTPPAQWDASRYIKTGVTPGSTPAPNPTVNSQPLPRPTPVAPYTCPDSRPCAHSAQ
jgi:hypothetical protein